MNNPHPYRTFENPSGLQADGLKARHIYYDSLGISYEPTDRSTIQSQAKQAFGVALSKRIGYALTAEVLEKERTTMNHYGKNHEGNLENWDGYRYMYENAEHVITHSVRRHSQDRPHRLHQRQGGRTTQRKILNSKLIL